MSVPYVTPPETAYLTMRPFYMPTESGTVWAVAFSQRGGLFVNAALAVAFALVFPWIWGLIAAAVLWAAPLQMTRRRSVAVVSLCNAPDPWSASKAFWGFTRDSWGKKTRTSWHDSIFGFTFGFLAFAIYIIAIVMGIIGPPYLALDSVAPVRPSELFYPIFSEEESLADIANSQRLQAAAAFRALGSVEIAQASARSDVEITTFEIAPVKGQPMTGFRYTYSLTGVDLGLVHGSGLVLAVEGECRTDYNWVNTTDQFYDFYQYWLHDEFAGESRFRVALNGTPTRFPPRSNFELHPEATSQFFRDSNVSYAVVLSAAHKPSPTAGDDPWYRTETPDTAKYDVIIPESYNFWISRGRPALSCWQRDKWNFQGQDLPNIYHLKNTTGVQIPLVLLEVLEAAFTFPMIQTIGSAAGMSALSSVVNSAGNVQGYINAGRASIHKDMERLIVASYVGSRSVFVESTLYQSTEDQRQANIFLGNNSQPREGANQLVIPAPAVQTFNLSGLIALATILAAVLLLKLLLMLKLMLHSQEHKEAPINENGERVPTVHQHDHELVLDRWTRFKALGAEQLLRNVYERRQGLPERDWKCCEALPEPNDHKMFQLVRCMKDDCRCTGHIAIQDVPTAKDTEAVVEQTPEQVNTFDTAQSEVKNEKNDAITTVK